MALNTLEPSIFADIDVPQIPLAIPRISTDAPVASPTPGELIAAEIESHYALHQLRACLGNRSKWFETPLAGSRLAEWLSPRSARRN